MTSITPPPLPGDEVGPYRLVSALGVGGMAAVYQAEGPEGSRVAVKILHPGRNTPAEIRLFKREFLALKALNHPGVVTVLDAGRHGDYPWMAMEFVDGTDLSVLIDRWRAAPPPDRFTAVEAILRGLCEALSYVHARGIVHRDIKPSNILITREGTPKLTDFGVAHTVGVGQTLDSGALVGTLAFMAPELMRGGRVDSRSDLYALGAVLYVMLTGSLPMQSDSVAGYLTMHLTERPRLPTEFDPRVPARLERLAMTLLQRDPSLRYASASRVLAALDRDEGEARRPVRGREALVERLLERLRVLQRGQGGMLVLVGPYGIGKSALLADLARHAREEGLDVAAAPGSAPGLLDALCDQLPILGDDARAGADSGSRLVRRARGRPWALLVDDLDRLAPPDLEALTALARDRIAVEGEPLLIVGTTASLEGPAAGLCSGASTGLSPERINVVPLDADAVVAMTQDLGVGGVAGSALGRRLAAVSRGRPQQVAQQLEALERAGWLVRLPDGALLPTCGLDDLRERTLPPLDVGLRPDSLPPLSEAARALLDSLVVLGGQGRLSLLRELAGEDDEALAELEAADVVRRDLEDEDDDEAERDPALCLADPTATAGLYASIPGPTRVALHQAAGRALQRRSRQGGGALLPAIAAHMQAGAELAPAYLALIDVARWHARHGRWEEARRWLRRAMDARPAAEPRLDTAARLRARRRLYALEGELHHAQQDWGEAVVAWTVAAELAEAEGAPVALAQAQGGLGLSLLAQGRPGRALDALAPAARGLSTGDRWWPPVVAALAGVYQTRGELEAAERWWRALLGFAQSTESVRFQAESLDGLARVAMARAELGLASTRLREALGALETLSEPRLTVPARRCAAELACWDGRLGEAREAAERARSEARRAGLLEEAMRADGLLAAVLLAAGETAGAQAVAREAAARAEPIARRGSLEDVLCLLPAARTLTELGEREAAAAMLPSEVPAGPSGLEGAGAQLLSLRARLTKDRRDAAVLAMRALSIPAPAGVWAAARAELDAALALHDREPDRAVRALQRALLRLDRPGLRLLSLEASALAARWGLGPRYATLARRLREALGPEVLDRWSAPTPRG